MLHLVVRATERSHVFESVFSSFESRNDVMKIEPALVRAARAIWIFTCALVLIALS
jgi:hypothetical protein